MLGIGLYINKLRKKRSIENTQQVQRSAANRRHTHRNDVVDHQAVKLHDVWVAQATHDARLLEELAQHLVVELVVGLAAYRYRTQIEA